MNNAKNAIRKFFQFDFKTRHAGTSALITIAVLAALILLNILLGETSIQADLTPKKLFSLTDETRALLDGLQREVEIYALFTPGQEPESIMDSVNEYERRSSMVSVQVLDPDRNPGVLARFTQDGAEIARGSFIVSSGSNYRVIDASDIYSDSYSFKVEQLITSAVAYVSSGRSPKIYEVVGHQETPLASLGFSAPLEQSNYTVEELSLIRSDIPDDAELLTLIGPRIDLSTAEVARIEEYLSGGGRLFIALNYSPEPQSNIYDLLRRWDIAVRPGMVLEMEANRLIAEFGDNPFISAPYITDHESLTALSESRLDPIFRQTMGFRRTEAEQRQLEYFPLLQSSKDSWLRTNLTSEESNRIPPIGGDEEGPVDVVVAVRQRNLDTYEPEGGVIVAAGSAATLAGLGFLGQITANVEMVMNLVNWAVGDESSVNVPSKSLYRLPLRIGNVTALIYAGVTIIVIPLGCILAGVVIWLRRRHR